MSHTSFPGLFSFSFFFFFKTCSNYFKLCDITLGIKMKMRKHIARQMTQHTFCQMHFFYRC
uniref:Uncharacterized protein n=1 Tax=Ascaris lumbricoides TaxID=6252 RepID=A0A0M3I3F8_ASCLU